ncbi:hypothetical protein DFR65_10445 [Oceanihabitans sediminis]|nr:hypothetical protein DFR65_10445 [Oceanihabitans sediminis]
MFDLFENIKKKATRESLFLCVYKQDLDLVS